MVAYAESVPPEGIERYGPCLHSGKKDQRGRWGRYRFRGMSGPSAVVIYSANRLEKGILWAEGN